MPPLTQPGWAAAFCVVSEVASTVRRVAHLYDPRPMASVLMGRTWRTAIVRMRHDDGRLNIQWTDDDGAQRLDNVAAETVTLWD